MNKHEALYVCDPKRNTACNRRTCAFKPPLDFELEKEHCNCFCTKNAEFAALDVKGKPMRIARNGHWIIRDVDIVCSECQTVFEDDLGYVQTAPFCSECGAMMHGMEGQRTSKRK